MPFTGGKEIEESEGGLQEARRSRRTKDFDRQVRSSVLLDLLISCKNLRRPP
jgi:hypothetical protein